MNDEEIEAAFRQAKALGAKYMTSSSTLTTAKPVVPFAEKHGQAIGWHAHSNVKDPDQLSTPDSFAKVMAMTKLYKVNLDIGHFTPVSFVPVKFIEQQHANITNLHIKDQKRNDGENMPLGRGDTDIAGVLRLLRDRTGGLKSAFGRVGPEGPGGMVMPLVTRRAFVGVGASTAFATLSLPGLASATKVRFKIGVTDWNLKEEGKIDAIGLAKQLGFDGVQISIGKGTEKLPLSDPGLQKAYLDESKRMDFKIASLCLEILHKNCLKSDPLGQRWVADSISIAKAMGVGVVLLPFFGKCALRTTAEMDKVGDILKELAPAAEEAGVILGLEDTISARDNVRIMDRTQSSAVLTYYDVGNSTNNGFDVVTEIRWLGRERICEVHLKDNPHYLGEGTIDFRAVIDTLADVGFDGWAQLETDSPVSVESDMRRNLKFIRGLIAGRDAS